MAQEERLKEAIATVVDRSTGPEVSPLKSDQIAASTVRAIKADPVLANASNQEPKVQSRIVWGGSTGLATALLALGLEIFENGSNFAKYDQKIVMFAISTTWAAGYVLYGRLMPGLKPMFYGWFGKG